MREYKDRQPLLLLPDGYHLKRRVDIFFSCTPLLFWLILPLYLYFYNFYKLLQYLCYCFQIHDFRIYLKKQINLVNIYAR